MNNSAYTQAGVSSVALAFNEIERHKQPSLETEI